MCDRRTECPTPRASSAAGTDQFPPTSESLAREGSVSRVALHHVRPLPDGSVVLLHEFRGDLDRVGAVLGEHPDVLAFDVVGGGSDSAYLRGRPRPAVAEVLGITPETVNEHLRAVESRVFPQLC